MIIGLVVAAHAATGVLIMHRVEEAMHHENHRRGLAVAFDLAHAAALSLISRDLAELRSYVGFSMAQEYVAQAMIVDPQGRIVMHNDLLKVGVGYGGPVRYETVNYGDHYVLESGEEVVDIRVPIEIGGTNLGTAVISYSHAGVKREIGVLRRQIFFIMLSGIAVAVICAVFLAEYIIRPLKHLCNVATDLGSGCFDIKRMGTDYSDEIGELARTFYDMAGKLEREVCHDTLTGLYTRNVFQMRLAEECAQSLRHHHSLAVLMLDVDHFKSVNDTFGHLAGDRVLQDIAALLQGLVRGEDCVARYGGEEFVVLLPQTQKRGALRVAEKIRSKVEKHAFLLQAGGEKIPLTISIGVGLFPDDTADFKWIIELADQALYAAKKEGRNRVCLVPGGKG